METIKATVVEEDQKYLIRIKEGDEEINILMSEDKANEVKSAFNKLITRIKRGKFKIELQNVTEDLFSQVANEYISQLNREIIEVYGEMKKYDLIKE